MSAKKAEGAGGGVRLADVAAAGGVSLFTVSGALRGDARVAAGTRARIVALAAEMGYEPDAAAALLAGRRAAGRQSNERLRIGLVDPGNAGGWRELQGRGFEVVELVFPPLALLPQRLRQWWNQGLQGLVVNAKPMGQRAYLEAALAEGVLFEKFAVVTVGPSKFACVRDDPFRLMRGTLERVVAKGYGRVAVLMAQTDQLVDDDARLGAVLAFRQRVGRRVRVVHRMSASGSRELGRQDVEWLRAERPEVVIQFPGGQYWALRDAGFRMPEDFAYCGVPLPLPFNEGPEQVAGMVTEPAEIFGVALELMRHQLQLGLRGLQEHPLVRLMALDWQEGKTLPERGNAERLKG